MNLFRVKVYRFAKEGWISELRGQVFAPFAFFGQREAHHKNMLQEAISCDPTTLVYVPGFPTLRKTGVFSDFLPSEIRFFRGQKPCFRVFLKFG